MAFGGTTKFKDIQAAHDTASSTHATAVVVHELDGLHEELQRRAEGVANQLLALMVATAWTLQGSSGSY